MLTLSRRKFLASTVAAVSAPRVSLASPTVLRAGPAELQILPDGSPPTKLLGFNGSTPGPALRYRQGEQLAVRLENGLDEGTAIHWHGIRLKNVMDGVPGMTQSLVSPGEHFDYAFELPDAGTYWYHSHHRSWEQVAKGLYGPLIIEETTPPPVDHDVTVMLDDWRIEETGPLMGGFGNRHDFSHAGRLGNNAMVLPSQSTVRAGDRIRVRLINTATARIFPLRVEGMSARVVALDGMPLPAPRALEDVQIAPAQRIDLLGDVEDTVRFLFLTRDEAYEMGSLTIEGENPSPKTDDIPALPPARVAPLTESADHRLDLRMEGGAMSGGHAGDDIWAFNGISGMTATPFATFNRGESAEITLINDTRFAHGIHLHGHYFHELQQDGDVGDYRDTTLVQPRAAQKIVAVFDNPGKWLLHCHMLGHQAAGMKTWIEVI